jgi:acetylornithine deacetylase
MPDPGAAALAGVDDVEVVRTVAELVAIPSIGGSAAEVEIQHHLARRLKALGLAVDLWPIDLTRLRATRGYPGEEVDRPRAYGLVARSRPGVAPQLVLQGHVDVVPPGDRSAWQSDPFGPVIAGGTVTGRGACDMKSGVAAILGAVTAVGRSGATVPAFAVHLVVGEEDGGIGAYATLERGHGGSACIIPEPTGCALVTANAGALTFRIDVPGLATHGSTAYAGSSAIDAYLPIHQALGALESRRNARVEPLMQQLPVAYPLSVGRVRAGDWPSSVPGTLVAEGRFGLRIEENPEAARRELEEAVLAAAVTVPYLRDHPPTITWPGGQFAGGRLPEGHRLADLVGNLHHDVTGSPIGPARGVPYGSDLRLYAAAGIPTLHYGPGDLRFAHGPNEFVPISELLTVTRVLTLALARGFKT